MQTELLLYRLRHHGQRGINMVDLMMWLVIAALLLAAAIQGIGYYQTAAWAHQAKTDLSGAQSWTAARVANTSEVPTGKDMQKAMAAGELTFTGTGDGVNTGFIASKGDSYCVGIRAVNMQGDNLFYSSSDAPNTIVQASELPSECGTAIQVGGPGSIFDGVPTWSEKTEIPGIGHWRGVDSSDDGTKLVAVDYNDSYIYTSSDSGTTWEEQDDAGPQAWREVVMSHDGTRMVASQWDGYIWTSDNAGVNWTQRTTGLIRGDWRALGASRDNEIMYAGVWASNGGGLFKSTDYGKTWNATTAGSGLWRDIAVSEDGSKVVAVRHNGFVYTSKNGGTDWISHEGLGSGAWTGATISDNGLKMAVVQDGGGIYTSDTGGDHWIKQPGAEDGGWSAITSSADGDKLAATQKSGGYLYTSVDSGETWKVNSAARNGNWWDVAMNADGSQIIAGKLSQYLYVGTY